MAIPTYTQREYKAFQQKSRLVHNRKVKQQARRRELRTMYARQPIYHPPTPEQIRALRKSLLMTQAMFASQLNLAARDTVTAWEIGRWHPSRRKALMMAHLALLNGIEWHKIEEYVPAWNGRGEPRRRPS